MMHSKDKDKININKKPWLVLLLLYNTAIISVQFFGDFEIKIF